MRVAAVDMGATSVDMADMAEGSGSGNSQPTAAVKAAMTVLTFAILSAALAIVVRFAM